MDDDAAPQGRRFFGNPEFDVFWDSSDFCPISFFHVGFRPRELELQTTSSVDLAVAAVAIAA